MSTSIVIAALLSTLNLEGQVTAESGDYEEVAFEVPAGTVEIHIHHDYPEGDDILDWGVRDTDVMRGWGGGTREDIIIGVSASSTGYRIGEISPGTWALVVGKAQLKSASVSWTAKIEFLDEATLPPRARSAYTPVSLSEERRWYAGDFHVHSEESGDSKATLSQIHQLAREQGLDFIALSNHNTISGFDLQAAAQAEIDDLLLMRANEVTTYQGHGNAIGYGEIVDHRVGSGGRTADRFIADVAAGGGVFAINHPNLGLLGQCIGCSWEHEIDWSNVGAIEVLNGKYDLAMNLFTPAVIEMWEEKLGQGHRIAAIGGSDDHRAGIDLEVTQSPIAEPTTWVLADSLSEEAIVEGVRAGRTWVQLAGPGSPRIDVELVGTDGQTGTIGDTLTGESFDIVLQVEGGEGMRAALYRDGALAELVEIETGASSTLSIEAKIPEGGARYHLEITDGKARTLTSHFYGEYEASPSAGCGCGATPKGSRGSWLAALLLLALSGAVVRKARRS